VPELAWDVRPCLARSPILFDSVIETGIFLRYGGGCLGSIVASWSSVVVLVKQLVKVYRRLLVAVHEVAYFFQSELADLIFAMCLSSDSFYRTRDDREIFFTAPPTPSRRILRSPPLDCPVNTRKAKRVARMTPNRLRTSYHP